MAWLIAAKAWKAASMRLKLKLRSVKVQQRHPEIMKSKFIKSLLIIGILVFVSMVNGQTAAIPPDKEAQRIWELAIEAKGGRKKLYSIQNIYISSLAFNDSKFKRKGSNNEFLIVYPNKYWEWDDKRPSQFGLTMEMYNLEIQRKYIVSQGQKNVELKTIEKNDPVSRRFSALIWLTLDNKWLHPVPEKLTFSKSDLVDVDVVQTKLDGQRIDFALEKKSHLPVDVIFYLTDSNNEEDVLLYKIHLSDYSEQDGIMVPKTVDKDKKVYQFNVEYNKDIFIAPPLPAENAADAWKKK